MRLVRIACVLSFGFATACSGNMSPADDDDTTPDAASPGGPDAGGGGGDLPVPASGFQIVTPEITLAPGEETTWCYYTTLGVDAAAGVKRWESRKTPGSHHLILFFTATAEQPDGTLEEGCGFGGGGGGLNVPVWTYSAQTPENAFDMPAGIGMNVDARQPAFVQMHYLNTTEQELKVHVSINGHTYAAAEQYTPAAAYVTYNTQIDVPAGQEGSAEGRCAVPAGKKFFTLSTHAHRFSTHTEVHDGDAMIFQSDNWEHPGAAKWSEDPFYEFTGDLVYHCDYYNFSDARVQTGNSAKTNEMCMAVGYFFPASQPIFCLDSFVVPSF